MRAHIATLETAITGIVTNAPATGRELLMAEDHMAGTAAVLAQGIVAAKPALFGA